MYLESQGTRWFYGHFSQALVEVLSKLEYRRERLPHPKKGDRIRGYRDHGTLNPPHKWIECTDESFTIEQVRIEEEDEVALTLSFSELLHFQSTRKTEDPSVDPSNQRGKNKESDNLEIEPISPSVLFTLDRGS